MNNIDLIRTHLLDLPYELKFDDVSRKMAQDHENDIVGNQIMKTLNSIVTSAQDDLMQKSRTMLQTVGDNISIELEKYTTALTKDTSGKLRTVDPLLAYMKSNLDMLKEKLGDSMFPLILEHVWESALKSFADNLLTGERPAYYSTMSRYLHYLVEEVTIYMCECKHQAVVLQNSTFCHIKEMLEINKLQTDNLIKLYYQQLSYNPIFMDQDKGEIEFKVGYQKERNNLAAVHLKILSVRNLTNLSHSSPNDIYIKATLQPMQYKKRTQTIDYNQSRLFGEHIYWPAVKIDEIKSEYSVLILSVWKSRKFMADEFLAECVYPLGKLVEIAPMQTITDGLVIRKPLQPGNKPKSVAFAVLESRNSWDNLAKNFVRRRLSSIGLASSICESFKSIVPFCIKFAC